MRVALALKALLHHDDTTQRLQVMTYGEILVVTEGLVGKDGVSGLLQVWADIVYVPRRPPPRVVGPALTSRFVSLLDVWPRPSYRRSLHQSSFAALPATHRAHQQVDLRQGRPGESKSDTGAPPSARQYAA